MTLQPAGHRLCGWIVAGAVAVGVPPHAAAATDLAVFHVFLHDGRVVHSHGECATLPDELVCVVRLGGGAVAESFDVLTVPRALVDEARTSAYARALRSAHYGATRGEQEYAALTADLVEALAELERTPDPGERLTLAQQVRVRLVEWSASHYGYRASDVRQLVDLLDEVINELRIAAGETRFALDLVAGPSPVENVPLRPTPGADERIEAALAAAQVTPVAAERLAILRSAHRVASQEPSIDAALRRRVQTVLSDEETIERQYQALMRDAVARADVAVRHGRVGALRRLIQEVREHDVVLGRRRPREMAAFGRRLDVELALAEAQRDAFERWTTVKDQLLAYELRLRPVFDRWVSQRPVLDALRRQAVPSRRGVDVAVRRFADIEATLAAMRPLREVAEVHAVLQSAVQMARQGLLLGERLTVARNAEVAMNASAAVAGAELLLASARRDLVPALGPRKVR